MLDRGVKATPCGPNRPAYASLRFAEIAADAIETMLRIPLRASACATCGLWHVDLVVQLSTNDLLILRETALGKPISQITSELGRTKNGFFVSMTSLCSRAGAANRTHLAFVARELGILNLRENTNGK